MGERLRDAHGRYVPATRQHGLFSKTMPTWVHAKAACYVYETNTEGVDFGIIIEGEGTLFLSKQAIREAAEVVGLTMIDGVQELEEDLAYAEHDRDAWKAKYEALREGLDAARRQIPR